MRLKLLLCVLLLALSVNATTVVGGDSLSVAPVDSTKVTRKHPWLAGLEVVGFNVGLLGFNKYLRGNPPWTHVTLNSIKHNITQRYWSWDGDTMDDNTFRHPVHGSVLYMIARANGMNIWESGLYSLGGTWFWEVICESQDPSINDLVFTSVGGTTIGEVAWRTGKSWLGLISKKYRHFKPAVPFSTSLSIGYRHLNSPNHQAVNTAMATLDIAYGDMFDSEHTGPFDYFEASGTAVVWQSPFPITMARIDHQLLSRPIIDKPNQKVFWGLYNHFDHYHTSSLKKITDNLAPSSSLCYSEVGAIGPGIAYRVGKQVSWEQQLYVNGIIMGATPRHNFHNVGGDVHEYSYGSGYGARLYSKLAVGNWLKLGVRAQFSHLFTWDGFNEDNGWKKHSSLQGETGNAVTTILEPSLEIKPIKNLSLVCNGRYMHTHNNYMYHPHGSISAWEWQVGVRYGIEL